MQSIPFTYPHPPRISNDANRGASATGDSACRQGRSTHRHRTCLCVHSLIVKMCHAVSVLVVQVAKALASLANHNLDDQIMILDTIVNNKQHENISDVVTAFAMCVANRSDRSWRWSSNLRRPLAPLSRSHSIWFDSVVYCLLFRRSISIDFSANIADARRCERRWRRRPMRWSPRPRPASSTAPSSRTSPSLRLAANWMAAAAVVVVAAAKRHRLLLLLLLLLLKCRVCHS